MRPPDDPTIELFMVEVRVADWPGCARWYVDVLGLRPVLEDRDRRFLLLEAGPTRVALKEGPPAAAADRGAIRLIFRVGDLDATVDRLSGLGVEVGPVSESAEGYREVRLSDPEGTPIHLFAWAGPSAPGGG